jgi:arginine-tRNA-protein transferase
MDIRSGGTRSGPDRPRPDATSTGTNRRSPPRLGLLPRQFFATASVPCPYVPGRAERKLVLELTGPDAAPAYDDLSRAGFRRSHRFAYRPACRACAACVPVRIAAAGFVHSRSTRRVRNVNADLHGAVIAPRAGIEQFRLFLAYQHSRHRDSDMATMNYGEYRAMIEDTAVRTDLAEFRDGGGALAAVTLFDRLDDGLSAVYTFFDPAQRRRSLGTWCILWLIEECRRRGLAYVYLGYWIADSPKMAYKARFPALEQLVNGAWAPFARGNREGTKTSP